MTLIQISIGEIYDRMTILDIKQKRILDPTKLIHVQNELNEYVQYRDYKNTVLYKLLFHINLKIWDLTDQMRTIKHINPEFNVIAHNIFKNNDSRFRIKNKINYMLNSNIKEQKNTNIKQINIYVVNKELFIEAICFFNYLIIEYDIINIIVPETIDNAQEHLFNIIYDINTKINIRVNDKGDLNKMYNDYNYDIKK